MKTAVILTGQARSFRYTFKTLDWCLFRKLPNPHFFVSVADDAQAPDMDLLRERYENVHIEYVKQPESIPEPEGNLDQHAGWFRSASVQSILKQFWALQRGYEFFSEHSTKFDQFVRCRPDLWCQDIRLPMNFFVGSDYCHTPWWSTFGGVNDRMAIMGAQAAEHYFKVFSKRERLWATGCPLHPETMLRASLEEGGVTVIPKWLAEFRICRLPDKDHPSPYIVPEQLWQHDLAALTIG